LFVSFGATSLADRARMLVRNKIHLLTMVEAIAGERGKP
jgi:hypothetical protein